MPTLLVQHIHTLATMDAERRELQDAAIFVQDGVIEWVGLTDDIPPHLTSADEVLNLSHHVVIPGLVNTHHHMYQSLTRVVAQNHELFDWLTTLYPIWANLRSEHILCLRQACYGRVDFVWLHHLERSSLHIPQRHHTGR